MRLLLMEDDAMIAESVQTSLRQGGYAADGVRNGELADTVLKTEYFDLVLDLGLPGKSGIEVLRHCASSKRRFR